MSNITRVGVDLAKNVIQVHAVDAAGKLVTSRTLKRDKFLQWCAQLPSGCLVAMEACGGAHHWCRKLRERGLSGSYLGPHRVCIKPVCRCAVCSSFRANVDSRQQKGNRLPKRVAIRA